MNIKDRFKQAAVVAAKPIAIETQAFGLVYVKQITAVEAAKLRKLPEEKRDLHWLAQSVCDEAGAPIFDLKNVDDVGLLNELGFRDLAPLMLAIYAGNGEGPAGQVAAEKN